VQSRGGEEGPHSDPDLSLTMDSIGHEKWGEFTNTMSWDLMSWGKGGRHSCSQKEIRRYFGCWVFLWVKGSRRALRAFGRKNLGKEKEDKQPLGPRGAKFPRKRRRDLDREVLRTSCLSGAPATSKVRQKS